MLVYNLLIALYSLLCPTNSTQLYSKYFDDNVIERLPHSHLRSPFNNIHIRRTTRLLRICKKYLDPGRLQSSGIQSLGTQNNNIFKIGRDVQILTCVPKGILDEECSLTLRDLQSHIPKLILVVHPFLRLGIVYLTHFEKICPFNEFINIVLKNPRHVLSLNEKKVHALSGSYLKDCQVCDQNLNPDIILKIDDPTFVENLENFQDEFNLKDEEMDMICTDGFLSRRAEMGKLFKNLSRFEMDELSEFYSLDMELFGYDPAHFYSYI
ncbi:uncharacterized protein [Lepeophtheirus salmonis]|uniref:uncharacterized protein n=1 Tax=Lepeophtheirus salmonis TaxID=72036 RepID=UPI001AE78D49|nr:uncharacterized protein LOC121125875 [Lepeophtheirus salmonis]